MGARSVSHPLCTGKSGGRSMSFCQHSTTPQHLSEVIRQFTEWKMSSKGSNTSFCERNIYLVLRCPEQTRQSSFFSFLFFFWGNSLPFKVTSKQTSKWQQKGKCCVFMASPLMNRTALGWVTSLCLRFFQRMSEDFILQCLQYRWKRECLYAYFLCLSVPGSEMCLVTGGWFLLFPSFAAELWTAVLAGEGERMRGVCAQDIPTGSTRVPSLCVSIKMLRAAALCWCGEQSIPQWMRADGMSPACDKRGVCVMFLLL